jgi:radical SAM superfamily enzyme YgiQ (UPF0313 family)
LISIISARGCFFNCIYCHNNFWKKLYQGRGRQFRRRSVENVISELRAYKEKYKVNKFSFEDDLFVSDKAWLEEFSHSYAREINLPFFCSVHPGLINEDVMHLLKSAGCGHLFIGIDSINDNLLKDLMKRDISRSEIKNNIEIARKYKIPLELSMIFGWPNETPEDMWEGIKFVEDLRPAQVQSQTLCPYPGTDILKYCQENGLIGDWELSQIYEGRACMVAESILKHKDKDLAYVIIKLLPFYIKSPSFLKPVIKIIINKRKKRFAGLLFVLTRPVLYPLLGWFKLRELFLMMLINFKFRFFTNILKFRFQVFKYEI